MRKVILLILTSIIVISCQEKSFFSNFDTIEYYSQNENNKILSDDKLLEKSDLNYTKILYKDFPTQLNDSVFYSELNTGKFIKNKMSKSDVNLFQQIFDSSTFTEVYTTACIPEYNDILILKKSKEIVGVVKICIGCKMYYIIGENEENKNIKKSGGIENSELENLLNKYNKKIKA